MNGIDLQQRLAALTDADRAAARQRAAPGGKPELDFLNAQASPPLPLGDNPQCVKGAVFPGTFSFANRVLPDGARRIKARLAHPFFDQKFDAGAWYDVYGLFMLQRALAAELSLPFDLLLLLMSREQVMADLNGALRFMLKIVSTKTIASTLTLMGSSWWSFMKYKTQLVAPQRLEIRAEGVPYLLRNVLCLSGAEYNAHALRVSGSPSARFEIVGFDGPRQGIGVGIYALIW